MPNQPFQRLEWADLGFSMYQVSPRADLALKWADLGFPMYQISPKADLALEWADLGFTLCHISPALITPLNSAIFDNDTRTDTAF